MDAPATSRNKANIFGNIVAFLPLVYLLFILFWHGISLYDDHLNLIGPAWVLDWGGEDTPFLLGYLCKYGGLIIGVIGMLRKSGRLIGQGVWAGIAGFLLDFWYMWMTF